MWAMRDQGGKHQGRDDHLIRRRNSIAIRFTSAAISTRLSGDSGKQRPHHNAKRHRDQNILP